jgi:hypothetical protein
MTRGCAGGVAGAGRAGAHADSASTREPAATHRLKAAAGYLTPQRNETPGVPGHPRDRPGQGKIAVLDINRQLKNKVDGDEVEPIVERVLARATRG